MKVLKRTAYLVLVLCGLLAIAIVANLDAFKRGFKRGYERQEAIELAKAFAEAESVQSMLPIQANETTKLIAITSEGNRVIYGYTLSRETLSQDEIDEMQETAVYNACTGPNIRKMLDRGVLLSHVYKTERTSKFIVTVQVSKDDCTP